MKRDSLQRRRGLPAVLAALTCAAVGSCASDRPVQEGSDAAPPTPDPAAEEAAQPLAAAAEVAEATPETVTMRATAASAAAVPVATDPAVTTVWEYLAARYDGDRDGTVTTREYTRNAAQFERWDRDGDGALSPADFEREARDDGGRGREDMQTGMARRMLARYFQVDDDAKILTLAEAADAFELYDGSDGTADDGVVNEGEFTCAMEERLREVPGDGSPMIRMGMGSASPWPTLLAAIDGDEDGALTLDELSTFFEEGLGTDTIDYTGYGASRARAPRAAANVSDGLAAQEGGTAPDFTLASHDGGETFTLSDFRGDRPVALIFGSYT